MMEFLNGNMYMYINISFVLQRSNQMHNGLFIKNGMLENISAIYKCACLHISYLFQGDCYDIKDGKFTTW